MMQNQDIRPAQVIGPLGEPLSLADLPSPKTKRWVVRRKAEVVAAVNGGLLTIDEPGVYYGQCSELCGKDHAYMPITVKVVSQEAYDAWLAASEEAGEYVDPSQLNG